MSKLTATKVRAINKAGRYGDGDGLHLFVSKTGAKSWVVRCQKNGRRRDIGLGSVKKVSLADARKRAANVRIQIEAGIDPVLERSKAAGIPTFKEAAALVFAESTASWSNGKHKWQWMASLEKYAFPTLADRTVDDIDDPAVREVIAAMWLSTNQTAIRVRQRINTIIDWAVAKGYRASSLNMAVINKSLPKLPKGHGKHHKAMAFNDVPELMNKLKQKKTISSLALQAAILCASRSNEVRLASWDEIDFDEKTWTIPAGRMKKRNVEHVIPLSDAMLDILDEARAYHTGSGKLIFEGKNKGKPLSDMTLIKILRDMGLTDTVHGFRSSFKDWAAETTDFPNILSEAALHHAIKSESEAAYRRGTLLTKRRVMMDAWANHCFNLDQDNVLKLAL